MHSLIKLLTTAILILALLSAGCTDTGNRSVDSPPEVATEKAIEIETSESKNNDNLIYIPIFNVYINGTKSEVDDKGNYHIVDENKNVIFVHQENGHNILRYVYAESAITRIQRQRIEDDYVYFEIIDIEKIDINGDGKFDQVALNLKTRNTNYQVESFTYVHEHIEDCNDEYDYLSVYIAEELGVPWWSGDERYKETTVSTMFGTKVYGIKYSGTNYYRVSNKYNRDTILMHSEYPHFDLYYELRPEQSRALVDQYGSVKSVTMEQADTDGDGELDTVAVKYVGSKGEFSVGVFACSVDVSNINSKETGSFDMCFRVVSTRPFCDDVNDLSVDCLIYYYLEPDDEWVLSILERVY